ncbi:MAG: hypothetical protein WD845_15330 [Pirellulales bacterium]
MSRTPDSRGVAPLGLELQFKLNTVCRARSQGFPPLAIDERLRWSRALRQASEDFARIRPDASTSSHKFPHAPVSAHTNFQMAAASLAAAVSKIARILDQAA